MNKQRLMLAFVLLLAIGLNAGASEIYKRVNEDGVIEFSDRPSADANAVEVRPNVVGTRQVQRPERRTAASESAPPADPVRSVVSPSSSNNTSYVNPRDRALRSNDRERREQRRSRADDEEMATDPNPGRALRNAARNAPGGAR